MDIFCNNHYNHFAKKKNQQGKIDGKSTNDQWFEQKI